MSTRPNIHEAKAQFLLMVDEVSLAEEIIIAKAGKPAAKLVLIDYKKV